MNPLTIGVISGGVSVSTVCIVLAVEGSFVLTFALKYIQTQGAGAKLLLSISQTVFILSALSNIEVQFRLRSNQPFETFIYLQSSLLCWNWPWPAVICVCWAAAVDVTTSQTKHGQTIFQNGNLHVIMQQPVADIGCCVARYVSWHALKFESRKIRLEEYLSLHRNRKVFHCM
jgi:hypothetical protein